ncbi:ANKRD50 [Symbiodinium microadriaticum]|nr:ANKRD50 [Symbiodinium microadriaticum]
MLRVTLLSGEELTSLPLAQLSDVKGLKQRLHQQHGLPPRFRQRLLHDGNPLDDAVQLDTAMDLQAVIVPFIETRAEEGPKLFEAAASGRVDQAAALI